MGTTHIDLFNLAEQRLAWADRRQAVLAQNVANANTPGYKPQADTATTHQLVTTIYKTYLGMFGTALGRGAAG
jgi:flagellar basal-body rod protein FlgB